MEEDKSQTSLSEETNQSLDKDWNKGKKKVKKNKKNPQFDKTDQINPKKKPLAPRSSLQFKVGPPFTPHNQFSHIIISSNGNPVYFTLEGRIDRGFDSIAGQWVGYKRNYFTLVAAFQSSLSNITKFLEDSFTLELKHLNVLRSFNVIQFGINVHAKISQSTEEVGLVEHTTKRDKGPHGKPKFVPLVPSKLPDHNSVRAITNMKCAKNGSTLANAFYFHLKEDRKEEKLPYCARQLFNGYTNKNISKVAKFERLQFASSSGVKNKSGKCKLFQLHIVFGVTIKAPYNLHLEELPSVELLEAPRSGNNTYFVHLLEKITPPLIIRGRSPAHYTEEGDPIPIRRSQDKVIQNKTKIEDSDQKVVKESKKPIHKKSSSSQCNKLTKGTRTKKVGITLKRSLKSPQNKNNKSYEKHTIEYLTSNKKNLPNNFELNAGHSSLKRPHTGTIKCRLKRTLFKRPHKIIVKCSFPENISLSQEDINKDSDVSDSFDLPLNKINFLEESSPLKRSIMPLTATNLSKFKLTPQFNRLQNISKENIDNVSISNFNNISLCAPDSTMSSPIKLRSPNKIPLFMIKNNDEESLTSNLQKVEKTSHVQTLEELEKEISNRRQILMKNTDLKPEFKLIDSPDKKLPKSVNFKDIETNVFNKPRPENIVLLGSVLYSNNQSLYHNSRYNKYQNYIEDNSPKFNRSYIRRDINSTSSDLNTNELSATNLTFSHLYEERSKVMQNRKQNGKSDPTQFTSEDNILNYIIEGKEKQSEYSYLAEPRTKLELLSSASDSLLLNDLQNSDGIRGAAINMSL